MMTDYSIGVRGCQHLGYAASGFTNDRARAWNQRVTDGHIAHRLTVQSMIDHGVHGLIDGGDIAHFNRPLPRDIEVANRVDDLRHSAGLWGLGNSGNHDAGGGSDISAAGVMHRPAMGMVAVYPDPGRGGPGVGPHPGLYEIHTAATLPGLPDGIALHVVSHYGLSRHLPKHGVTIDPQPLPGKVNLLFAHGTFEADDRLYTCIQPHGEERPIPAEWVLRGWDATLLSHYHTLGPVPGFGDTHRGQVWYTGSALRRGFSDDEGDRGWLKVTISDAGVQVTPVHIWQRPQFDLPVVDAMGLSLSDIDDQITANLASTPMTCDVSAAVSGHAGAIVRQKVINATADQRLGLAKWRGRYTRLTADCAHWLGLGFDHPRVAGSSPIPAARTFDHKTTDFTTDLHHRYPRLAHNVGVPDPLRDAVRSTAAEWTDQISPDPTFTS